MESSDPVQPSDLAIEWSLLQNQYDSYEKFSLLIKLLSIGIFSTAYLLNKLEFFMLLILLTLWLQDAIWKTFQARIETRILQLEACVSAHGGAQLSGSTAYQFNSLFLKNRPSAAGLIAEYARQAVKPTVAFPHALLLLSLAYTLL